MKLLPRLIIALFVCLIAIPVLAIPEQVQAAAGIELSDVEGYVGTEIRVVGTELSSTYRDETVYIRYEVKSGVYETVEEEDVDSNGNFTSAKFKIPDSCRGDHYVGIDLDESGIPPYRATFTVGPEIEITDPSSAKGFVGDTVEVTGTGFAKDEASIKIKYEGDEVTQTEAAATDEYGTWKAKFIIPESVKGEHDIDAKGADTVYADVAEVKFTVKPKISLNLTSGSAGDIVAVNGTGFQKEEANINIKYDDEVVEQIEAAETDELGSWSATFKVPPSVKGSYKVDAYGKYTKDTEVDDVTFTVAPGVELTPATSSTSPGYVGQTITVTGGGFDPGISITIVYGNQTASATTTAEGNFPATGSITFEAKGTHGEQEVVVKDNLNHVLANTTFFMEENPPAAPEPLSPVNGTGVGFVGKVTPTFKWSNVTDPSGIASYKLQISTNSTDFTAPIVSLSIPSENVTSVDDTIAYALPKEYALSSGTYYWKLRAIDGAGNEGGWTAVQTFYTGHLPSWAFIVIIGLVVVGIGALVYFFVIKPRRSFYYNYPKE
jgi:exosome complex RNA-binding protein Csl4